MKNYSISDYEEKTITNLEPDSSYQVVTIIFPSGNINYNDLPTATFQTLCDGKYFNN